MTRSSSAERKESPVRSAKLYSDGRKTPAPQVSFRSIPPESFTHTENLFSSKRPVAGRLSRHSSRRSSRTISASVKGQKIVTESTQIGRMSLETRPSISSPGVGTMSRHSDHFRMRSFYGHGTHETFGNEPKNDRDLFRLQSGTMKGSGSGKSSRSRTSTGEKPNLRPQVAVRRPRKVIPHPRPRHSDTTSAGQTA